YPADVPFFTPDPKSPERLGPTALMTLVVMNGQVNLKYRDNAEGLQAPPGAAVMGWSSTKGIAVQPQHLNKLPEAAKPSPQLPADLPNRKQAEQLRADMDRALGQLSIRLSGKLVDVGLAEARASNDPNLRVLAMRCWGALDDLKRLVEYMD